MSSKRHRKQVERARAKRQAARSERRAVRNRIVILIMVALLVLGLVAGALAALLSDPAGDDVAEPPEPPEDEQPLAEPCPTAEDQDVPDPVTEPYDEPPRYDLDEDATYLVTFVTTCGDFTIELDTDGAPRTTENLLALADDGYYDGTPFHRVSPGFVAQGGDPTGTGTGCVDEACEIRLPGYQLEDELDTARALPDSETIPGGVDYPRGTVAMANSGPDTQGSQFFVVQADPAFTFAPDYTILGEVVDGIEVVDRIVAGPTGGLRDDEALDPVYVTSVDIEQR